jgi:hypothetical protein
LTVVSFKDFEPTPRYDGIPWTKVLIDESENGVDGWTLIDTIVLNPVDADPAHPQARSFTTEEATLINGWYRVTFGDATNDRLQPTAPLHNIQFSNVALLPTLVELGSDLLRTRTKDSVGNELGTFTPDTRPTDVQARTSIQKAARDVLAETGTDIPDSQVEYVRNLIAIKAAMYIELSYYPEQVASNRSPYSQYNDMFKSQLASVLLSLEAQEAGDTGTPSHNVPAFSFPDSDDIMSRPM